MTDFLHLLKAVWPQFLIIAPGLYAMWKLWGENRKLARTQHADLIRLSEEIAARALERLEDDNRDLRERVAALEQEINAYMQERLEMLQSHATSMAEKDAIIAVLRGERRQMANQLAIYDKLLTAHKIDHPKPGSPHWQVEVDGELVPMQGVADAGATGQ